MNVKSVDVGNGGPAVDGLTVDVKIVAIMSPPQLAHCSIS